MKKQLTKARETFAYQVAKGLTHADAYRIAFPGSKSWKPAAVHVAASKLLANGKVAQRVKDYQARVEKKRVADLTECAERMTQIVRLRGRHELAIAATRQLCGMMGYNPAEKHEHHVVGDVSVTVAISERIKRLEERIRQESEGKPIAKDQKGVES